MKNTNGFTSDNLKKCPYQSKVYATDNIDLIYVKSYKGDWGHWDDKLENSHLDQNCLEPTENDGVSPTENINNDVTNI